MDRVGRPLFMRTYGKQTRKLNAWISPDNRKMVFDSTSSSTSDLSVAEPVLTKICVAKRGKKRSVASNARQGVRPAKTKAMDRLEEKDSDEENSFFPSPAPPIQQKHHKSVRTGRAVSKAVSRQAVRRRAQVLSTSESEGESAGSREACSQKHRRAPVGRGKTQSGAAPPAAPLGRFVTHRRGAAPPKPKIPRSTALMPLKSLNSSDEFMRASGSGGRPAFPRRATRGRPWELTPAESPVAGLGDAMVTNGHLREISSLNDSAEPSLEPSHRKPLFCSTPSLRPLARHRLQLHHMSASPSVSGSVSEIVNLSTTQEEIEVDPPEDPLCPSPLAPVVELRVGVKPLSDLGEPQEEPPQLSVTDLRRSSNGEDLVHTGTGIQNGGVEPPSLKLFSLVAGNQTDPDRVGEETEGSGHFVSASGGAEWLAEELKRTCVTRRCVVLLERVDAPGDLAPPHGETTFSSCLDHTRSASGERSADRESVSRPPFSVTCGLSADLFRISMVNDDHLRSVDSVESVNHTSDVVEIVNHLRLDSVESMEHLHLDQTESIERSQPMNSAESVNHTSSSFEEVNGLRSVDDGHVLDRTGSTDADVDLAGLTSLLKERCLTKQIKVCLDRVVQPQPPAGDNSTVTQPRTVTSSSSVDSNNPVNGQSAGEASSGRDKGSGDGPVRFENRRRSRRLQTNTVLPDARAGKPSEHILAVPNGVPNGVPKARKKSLAPQGRKRRSASKDRPGTTRKACVSGLSVSRWSRKDGAAAGGANALHSRGGRRSPPAGRAGDCSITELLCTRHATQPGGVCMSSWLPPPRGVPSTPVQAGRLPLSSLLLELTPGTHTWSRLKAALSVHRKTTAFFSPHHGNAKALAQGGAGLADVSQDLFSTPLRTPLPRRLQSQLQRSAPLRVCEDELSDGEKVYAECGQAGPVAWGACLPPARMKLCKKIGEGTYGEVFSTANDSHDTVALKIIPVEGSEKVNGEQQKTFGEILHEIIISKELSSLKEKQRNQTAGFIGLNDLHCVRGRYPPAMLKAWDVFDRQRGSENDRPDFFEDDQLFLILEFEFGGSDLENSDGQLSSLMVAKSVLHQVTAALAVAEQELCFEHRDLHWGNVLVKTTSEKQGGFLLNGTAHCLDTRGVHVRIIDYSLSRLEIDGLTVSCDISEDEELFMGQGDYQFEIYRLMRQENSNEWSSYQPHSNVLWLHYLCSKLLGLRYRGRGRGVRQARLDLQGFLSSVLQYRSATQVLQNCSLFR